MLYTSAKIYVCGQQLKMDPTKEGYLYFYYSYGHRLLLGLTSEASFCWQSSTLFCFTKLSESRTDDTICQSDLISN